MSPPWPEEARTGVVTQFSVQLRDQVDLDVLGDGLLGVVDEVLAPAHMSLWLREPGPFG